MSSKGSVSRLLVPLQQGDADAVQALWQRYFLKLAQLAHKTLRRTPLRAVDEEDVALSALDSFCRGAEQGRFPQLRDRHDLWRLLAVFTVREARRAQRDEGRQKRGGLEYAADPGETEESLLEQALSREPSPEMAVQMAEEFQRLLHLLGDDELRLIAVLRMESHTIEEVAVQVSCAPRSVKRKLQLIRTLWEQEEPS